MARWHASEYEPFAVAIHPFYHHYSNLTRNEILVFVLESYVSAP